MNRQRLLAWILVLLPLALLAASIGAVVASFAAWGAAAHVDMPDWETTAVGLVFAVPGVIAGALRFARARSFQQHLGWGGADSGIGSHRTTVASAGRRA